MTGRPGRPSPGKSGFRNSSSSTTTTEGGLQLRWKIREDDSGGGDEYTRGFPNQNLFVRLSSERLVRDLVQLVQKDKEKAAVAATGSSSETNGSKKKQLHQQEEDEDEDGEIQDHCWTLNPPSSSKRRTTSTTSINDDSSYDFLPLKIELKYSMSSTTSTSMDGDATAINSNNKSNYDSPQDPIQNIFTIYASYNGGIINPTGTRTDVHHRRFDRNNSDGKFFLSVYTFEECHYSFLDGPVCVYLSVFVCVCVFRCFFLAPMCGRNGGK